MATTEKSSEANRKASKLEHELSAENTPESPVVKDLRRQVANAFLLYCNYKHYHWQTYGPLFRDLHKLFDDFAEEVLETIDPLAERIRMIGQDPPAHPLRMPALAGVSASAREINTMREMVEEGNRNLLIVIKEIRDAAETADEHGDPGTVDLFAKIVQVHEKHEWWLRDILRTGDGLVVE